MERFNKYADEYEDISVCDIPDTEILSVTDKKFVLDITLRKEFHEDYEHDFDDELILDEVEDSFTNEFEDIMNILEDFNIEFDEKFSTSSRWFMYGKTKPITAQEVLKIKQDYESYSDWNNPFYALNIIDLV